MIAQPASPATPSALAALEQEVLLLRATLDDALCRIQKLEQQPPQAGSAAPTLFPLDSPAVKYAQELCAELFPGTVEIGVNADPDQPESKWYVFQVACSASIERCIELELQFGRRLQDAFPREAGDIRLLVARQ